jgi:hypothetical protein
MKALRSTWNRLVDSVLRAQIKSAIVHIHHLPQPNSKEESTAAEAEVAMAPAYVVPMRKAIKPMTRAAEAVAMLGEVIRITVTGDGAEAQTITIPALLLSVDRMVSLVATSMDGMGATVVVAPAEVMAVVEVIVEEEAVIRDIVDKAQSELSDLLGT